MSNFAATINAAPAYIVNDIYKRFINPNTTPKAEVAMSRFASLGVLVVGIVFGLLTDQHSRRHEVDRRRAVRRVRDRQRVEMVLVAIQRLRLLLGNAGRHSGSDDRAGAGPEIAPQIFSPQVAAIIQSNSLYMIPVLIVLSLAGCLLGTFLTEPEDDAILKHFYKTTRPWGFWGPIRDQVIAEDPSFQPNRDCAARLHQRGGRNRLATVPDVAANFPGAALLELGRSRFSFAHRYEHFH